MIIRPAIDDDAPAIARVSVGTWRSAYRGIVPNAYLAGLSYPKQTDRIRKYMAQPDTVYFVAELPAEGIVGFISGGRERTGDRQFPGEMYGFYILPAHQRQGIGSALVQRWAAGLQQAGLHAALVWVLAQNIPGVRFYEKLGGRFLREQTITLGGVELIERAYGWDDLSSLPKQIDQRSG